MKTIYAVAVEYDKTHGKRKSFVTCDYPTMEKALDHATSMIFDEDIDDEQAEEHIEDLKSRGCTTLADRSISILCSDDFPPEDGDEESDRSFACFYDPILDAVKFDLI